MELKEHWVGFTTHRARGIPREPAGFAFSTKQCVERVAFRNRAVGRLVRFGVGHFDQPLS